MQVCCFWGDEDGDGADAESLSAARSGERVSADDEVDMVGAVEASQESICDVFWSV